MRKFLPEHHVINKWSHGQRQFFSEEKEKCHSKPAIAEVVRQALRTKVSINIRVVINSSFKQQPLEVRLPQVVQGIDTRFCHSTYAEV